jgi:predicted tellurium resistance membrane protein TerC
MRYSQEWAVDAALSSGVLVFNPLTLKHLERFVDWITNPEIWIALVTLTVLEVVLGIDNVVFITILAAKLPTSQQKRARQIGLALAMVTRILLLLSISWIIRLTAPIFAVFGHEVSGRDLILLFGGLFLVAKATHEIHTKLEGEQGHDDATVRSTFGAVVVQIMFLDIIFSLDSVITAVGMVDQVEVMIAAVVIAVIVMMISVEAISGFVGRHPTVKMLALSFLLLIGVMLVAESFHTHIPKGYVYFAMGFSVFVEALNIRAQKVSKVVKLRSRFTREVKG